MSQMNVVRLAGRSIRALRQKENAIVVDKSGPDAFEGTNLAQELQARNIGRLVIAGVQTELCVNTTCRRAVQLGYEVILVQDGHTTFDWDEISAADTIRKHNEELSAMVDVQPAAQVSFI